MGRIRKTLRCWDSSKDCALAEPRTMSVMAMSEMAGETSSIMTSQLMPGSKNFAHNKKLDFHHQQHHKKGEQKETAVLKRKEESTLELKILFSERGQ